MAIFNSYVSLPEGNHTFGPLLRLEHGIISMLSWWETAHRPGPRLSLQRLPAKLEEIGHLALIPRNFGHKNEKIWKDLISLGEVWSKSGYNMIYLLEYQNIRTPSSIISWGYQSEIGYPNFWLVNIEHRLDSAVGPSINWPRTPASEALIASNKSCWKIRLWKDDLTAMRFKRYNVLPSQVLFFVAL